MKITVNLASPPDRDKLVVEIMCDQEQWAELHQEKKGLALEIYPRSDGRPWTLSYDETLEALRIAKSRLIGGSK